MATWLITGCSTGFGRELASAVLARNWNAVVTARDPATIQDIVAGHDVSALALRLDVTDPEQVASAAKEAEARFGAIDVLVNNAGYGYRGAVEEADETEVRELFETNFFGLVSMIQAVLPGMRAHRRGHIVNISSVAGRMAQPGSGYYSATKFAVGGLSDALRKEVGPLGIRVTVVEPGGFRTDFAGRSLRQSKHTIDDYAATAGARRKENSSTDGRQPGDPARAAQAIIRAVQADKPPFRLALGRSAVQRIRAEIDTQRQELDAWEETANGADYPA
ncbi:MAG: SDR family NAD(P)-dependent oxidoreductase [Reyranella sp.]|uniref:oxidoreductase n=1 Tax=Reyranella sp. TaxID=1929291 RepID=UPI0025DACB7E|nr:oxidoreductase [Reyranella sp.]MBR2813620.1 SDR family NAD(P)-dependent oxidoreductase [Reyranella sp.]